MIQLARQLDGADVISLGITAGRMLHGHVGSWQITLRLIEGQYLNWQALVPKRPASNALTVAREELAAAVRRAAFVADKGIVAVSYHDGGVTLAAKSPEHGEAHEEIRKSYCGHSFKTGFQASYLIYTLGALGGDVVVLQ